MGETSTIATGDAFAEDAEALKNHYRALVDDELRYIATHTELTETARAVLERELMARGITDLEDYKRQLSEEAPAERHWSERLWGHLFEKPDSPLAKPNRLEALITLLLGGLYIAPPARGEDRTTSDRMSPVLFLMVLYCLLAPGAQLVGMATMFAKNSFTFPLLYRLFSYLGPALLVVSGILLFKRSSAALALIALHLVWLAALNPVAAYVFEQYLLVPQSAAILKGWTFVVVLAMPALILAYGMVLRRKGVLR